MQNFSFPSASIQTDKFLTFFQENFKKFQKILKRNSKNSKTEFKLAKLVLAKFQLSSFPDGLRHFDIFPRKTLMQISDISKIRKQICVLIS
jgi:hypothetical protein